MCPMVIQSCAKYGMEMSKDKKLWNKHEVMSKLYKFDLEVKGQRHIGITNVRQTLVIDPYAKYDMSIPSTDRARRHDKTSINLTLRSKVNLVSRS